jgi:general secretion pathway protein H
MNKGERGFTLLELMVALAIISLVMAVSYAALRGGSRTLHLKTTGRDVLNTFRYAREKAVTEQTGTRVVIDREKQELILTNSLGEAERNYPMPKDIKITRVAMAGNEIGNGPAVIRFLPNGSCDSGEVLLQVENGPKLRIFTDPITGGARMESGSGEK